MRQMAEGKVKLFMDCGLLWTRFLENIISKSSEEGGERAGEKSSGMIWGLGNARFGRDVV
jgi:hypothetical protein